MSYTCTLFVISFWFSKYTLCLTFYLLQVYFAVVFAKYRCECRNSIPQEYFSCRIHVHFLSFYFGCRSALHVLPFIIFKCDLVAVFAKYRCKSWNLSPKYTFHVVFMYTFCHFIALHRRGQRRKCGPGIVVLVRSERMGPRGHHEPVINVQ